MTAAYLRPMVPPSCISPFPGSLWLPMALPISDEMAERFAAALVSHAGNRSKAAITCGYTAGDAARSAGRDLARHPAVLKRLQPLAASQLASLTPAAIQTLAGLLSNKSGYIRLEAAKDILNRNGVGSSGDPPRAQPLVIRINLGASQPVQLPGTTIDAIASPSEAGLIRPGGRKPGPSEEARTTAHDFSPEGDLGLDAKVPEAASRVLSLDLDDETPLDKDREIEQ